MSRPALSPILRAWTYKAATRLPGPTRRLTRPLLATGPLRVGGAAPANGLLLKALPAGHIQAWGLVHGVLEPPVQEALRRHVGPDSVVWDVGANVGFFSLLATRFGARVECFEPVAANVAAIAANVAANGLGERVGVHPVAVGATSGRAALCVVDEASWSHLADRGQHPRTAREETVDVVALDDLELPPPTLVKIDVEGSEGAVLDGAAKLLHEARPLLIVELHATNDEVCDRLEQAGYAAHNLEGPEPVREAGAVHLLAVPLK